MDLATILKDYSILITALVGLGMAILGYYFGKWDAERKRKWELENRQLDRRATIHDMRIQEARDMLDKWTTALALIEEPMRILGNESDITRANRALLSLTDEFRKAPLFLREAIREASIISILNDDELTNLLHKFYSTIQPVSEFFSSAGRTYNGWKKDIEKCKEAVHLEETEKHLAESEKILTEMKIRLDELAKTVP